MFRRTLQHTPFSSRERGFTLVEVVVAVIIAALALSALSGVFASGTRGAASAAELSRASALAQSLLAAAGVERPLTDSVESGTTADGLSWTLSAVDEMSEVDGEAPIKPLLILKRVTVRVNVPNAAQPERAKSVELSSLRAVPRPLLQ